MKGVIYARYSSDNQREESIEGQLRENKAFAEKNGIEIIETYIDRAFSAKTDNRPEFQRMIKESARKSYDVVIVWKLDRFARNRYDSAKYKAILKKNNIKVVSATEAISEGADGIILEAVLEGMAEYYSADLAEKVTRGMTENALKCKYNGGMCVPFGYVIDKEHHYQRDPANAPIALEIFTRYAGGESATAIINDLNARGLKTARGAPFNKNSFRNMVNNRNYIGEYHYRDVVIPGGVPAIVPDEIFEKATSRLKSNRRAPGRNRAKERYILTTKLFCGECKSMLVGESANKKTGTYRYYKCASAKRHECNLKPVRKELIEDYVIKKAIESITDEESVDQIIQQIMCLYGEDNATLRSLEQQLKDVQKAIRNVLKAIENGVFTRSTKEELETLETEEDEIKKHIEREKTARPLMTEKMLRSFLSRYTHFDLSVQRNRERIVDELVGSILLFGDGRLIITFNFRDNPHETTLDEIIAAANTGSTFDCLVSPKKTECKALRFLLPSSPRIDPRKSQRGLPRSCVQRRAISAEEPQRPGSIPCSTINKDRSAFRHSFSYLISYTLTAAPNGEAV